MTLYNEANSWYTQQQILSLFAGDYSKTELLQLVPGLTKFRIDANLHPSIRRVHPELVCGSVNNRKHFSNAESSKARSQPGVPKVRQRWMSLPGIGDRTGVKISRYDFSEPQAGKDICDRPIAAVKSHMRRFLNEGNDVKTASDMKAAIESYGGIKGCYAAECQAQASAQTMTKHTMTGVQGLHNFSYENGGMRMCVPMMSVWESFTARPSWPGLEHPKVPLYS